MNMNDAFLGSLIFNKNGGGGGAVLITKTITDNGIFDASADNADGFSRVTVNVAKGGLKTTDLNLVSTTYTTI